MRNLTFSAALIGLSGSTLAWVQGQVGLGLGLAGGTALAILSAAQQTRSAIARHRRLKREVEALYHAAPCGYHSLDHRGVVVKINDTELDWLGYSRDEVVGKLSYVDVVAPEDRERFLRGFSEVIGEERLVEIECDIISRQEERRTVLIRASAKIDDNKFVHSRAAAYDITERKQMENALRDMVRTDALTGLGNRRRLDEMGRHEINRHARTGSSLALAMVDIDHFKKVNDQYGHDAGDEVLKHLATIAQATCRDSDIVCRLGGEEFVFLLPDTDAEGARVLMDRLRKRIEEERVSVLTSEGGHATVGYTFSCGVCEVITDGDPEVVIRKAMHCADHALYVGKEAGRNRVIMA